MPRFFFDIHDGADIPDHEGTDLPDIEAAKREAVLFAGSYLRDQGTRFWKDAEWMVRVHDADHLTLFELTIFAKLAPALG